MGKDIIKNVSKYANGRIQTTFCGQITFGVVR